METKTVTLRVYTHDRGGFAALKDERVLLYWPHGFGDWVQFSAMLPFLEDSNRYWITRFGDDSVSLMEGHRIAAPIYLGTKSPHCEDGGAFGNRHFGLKYESICGTEARLRVPLSLYEVIRKNQITSMLWTWYPETHGFHAPPFHTKARAITRTLARGLPPEFAKPLPSTLCMIGEPLIMQIVEARLKSRCGFGERRLCLIGRNGYTSVGKNWGHLYREDLPEGRRCEGQECREFIQLMLKKSCHWCFLLMEDRNFADSIKDPALNTFAFSDLFGEPENSVAPFGQIMKCLSGFASLCVGVPAGPYHFAAQVPTLPTIGIWIEHLPSWYDEPREGLVHVIGRCAADRVSETQPSGSFLSLGAFHFRALTLETRYVPGPAVLDAAEVLLGAGEWRAPRSIALP